jgi:methionyl-tRNA formyltransferase
VQLRDDVDTLSAGVIKVSKSSVIVGTATTPVELGLVQAVGKRPMPAADWARGLRLSSEAVFV